MSFRGPSAGISRIRLSPIECNIAIVFCERLYVQQNASPHVHHVIDSMCMADEELPHRSVKRVILVLFKPGSNFRLFSFLQL